MVSEMLSHSSGEKFQALFNLYEHSNINEQTKNMGEKKILLRKTKMKWHFKCIHSNILMITFFLTI